MGNYTSKFFCNNKTNSMSMKDKSDSLILEKKLYCCTPELLTRKLQEDPRSVTVGILRTPIEVNYTGVVSNIDDYFGNLQKYNNKRDCLKRKDDIIKKNNEEEYFTPKTLNITRIKKFNSLHNVSDSKVVNDNAWNDTCPILLGKQQLTKNLDPRSPANDFDRTPILKVRSLEKLVSSSQDNLKWRKKNSKLDFCIRLSYCEVTSPFKLSEIQAIPDVVATLQKYCSIEDKIKNLNLSSINDNKIRDSNIFSKNTFVEKLFQADIPSSELISEPITKVNHKNSQISITNFHYENQESIVNTIKHISEPLNTEQNFIIYRDSYSLSYPSNISIYTQNLIQDPTKRIFENNEISIAVTNNIYLKNNKNRKIQKKTQEAVRYKKGNKILNKELVGPIYKNKKEVRRNRTPLSNRSNDNGNDTLINYSLRNEIVNTTIGNRNLLKNIPLNNGLY